MRTQDAKQIPLSQLLSKLGHEPVKETHGELWYLSPLRQEEDASFKVDKSNRLFFDFGLGRGGNVIDLGFALFNTQSVSDVLQRLDEVMGQGHAKTLPLPFKERDRSVESAPRTPANPPSPAPLFEDMTLKPLQNPALLHYLRKRGINTEIARQHVQEMHYRYNGKAYFALAFGNESEGHELRNPYFKGVQGTKDLSLMKKEMAGPENGLLLFEGFMDFLSYLTLNKAKAGSPAIILNGVGMGQRAIERIRELGVKEVDLYLDQDEAGRRLTEQFQTALPGITVRDQSGLYTGCKDLNDYLQKQNARERA